MVTSAVRKRRMEMKSRRVRGLGGAIQSIRFNKFIYVFRPPREFFQPNVLELAPCAVGSSHLGPMCEPSKGIILVPMLLPAA